jgi:hypothetical protein
LAASQNLSTILHHIKFQILETKDISSGIIHILQIADDVEQLLDALVKIFATEVMMTEI